MPRVQKDMALGIANVAVTTAGIIPGDTGTPSESQSAPNKYVPLAPDA